MDKASDGYAWRVFHCNDEEKVIAKGKCDTDAEAISAAYAALTAVRAGLLPA